MSRSTFLLKACFILVLTSDLYGQHIIRGTVSDSLSNPIPFVQVLLYDSTKTGIYGFTQGDSLGRYELKVDNNEKYSLTFNILSHKSKTIVLDLTKSAQDTIRVINVVLSSEPFTLEEVVVETERSIRVRGDTIAMKVDDFRRGDEEVVEDVLTKLPGIEVDDDGTIRFAGKQISKVMIEGTDMFGKGYSMLTKNLDANTIDEVEVLQNYLEEQELKGLAKSDEVALNLNLKDEVKLSFFGNATLGANTINKHEARLILTSLNKTTKQFLLLNSNSIGKDAWGDLDQFGSSANTLELSNNLGEINIDPWKNFEGYSLPLDAQRMRFNNSTLGSYNFFYSPGDNFELKIAGIGAFDKDLLNKETQSIFYTKNEVVRQFELQNEKDRLRNGIGKITSFYKPNAGSKIEYRGLINFGNTDATNDANTISRELFLDYNNDNTEITHVVRYSNRLNKNNAIILSADYRLRDLTQELFLGPTFAGEVFQPDSEFYEVNQEGSIDSRSLEINGLWLKRFNKRISFELSGSSSLSQLDNTWLFHLFGTDSTSTDLEGKNHYDNHLDSWINSGGVVGRFSFGSFNLHSGLNVNLLKLNYKNTVGRLSETEKVILKPKAGFDISFSNNKVQASYLYDASIASTSHMIEGYRFYDNRTLEKGLGKAHTFRGHNLFAQYIYGGWLRRKMLYTTFIYNRNDGAVANNSEITGEYSLIKRTLDTDREIYFANASADFLLAGLKNNLKVSGNLTYRTEGSFINDQYYLLKTRVTGYGFDMRSVFDGIFNYTLGASWLHQDLNAGLKRIRSKGFLYTDLYLEISKAIKFQFVAEREVVRHEKNKNSIYLLDALFHITFKRNKLEGSLAVRNILNNKYYVTNSLNGLSFYSTRYDLIPRNMLVSLKYRL